MPQNPTNIDFDELYDEKDNFEEEVGISFSSEGIDTTDGAWIPEIPTQDEKTKVVTQRKDDRTAQERIDDIFHKMGSQRHYLTCVLKTCESPAQSKQIEEALAEVQKHNASVYTAFNICSILECAGALARTTEAGELYDEQNFEPELVCIDGEEYLRPTPAPAVYWKTTAEGLDKLESFDPYVALSELYAQEPQFVVLYQRIFECLEHAQAGCTHKDFSELIDDDPLVKKPRFYAGYFIERLERCDAIVWKDGWYITDVGREFYERACADEQANTDAPEKCVAAKGGN